MTILSHKPLTINGDIIAYEGACKLTIGTKERKPNPQIAGEIIFTTDNSTNHSTFKVTVRNTDENNEKFEKYYNNGNNNVISYGNTSLSLMALQTMPENEDQGLTEYVFYGQPKI
jgi:hypothetical protein